MSSISITKNQDFSSAQLSLPYSKSLSNRALIIRELCEDSFEIQNLSDSRDTVNLSEILGTDPPIANVGPAGTNMRFLTSLFALKPGIRQLSGSVRLNQRPIGDLVNCLNQMGAEIVYMGNVGYPPLRIVGTKLRGGKVDIDGSSSSQFVSSILMIAPVIENGIELSIRGTLVSEPYIDMTLALMKYFGVDHHKQGNCISIQPAKYKAKNYQVEGDWSAAANWYGFVATSQKGTQLVFKNLHLDSLQGDKKCAAYFQQLGVDSRMTIEGLEIIKMRDADNDLHLDLRNEPDLFPPLVAACAVLKIHGKFEGLDTLTLKESDRIRSMAKELKKIKIKSDFTDTSFELTEYGKVPTKVRFNTYEDHRIAMALSIMIQNNITVEISDPEVVSKSYPNYWEDLKLIRIANIY